MSSTGIESLNEKFKRFVKNGYKFDIKMREERKKRNIKIYESVSHPTAKAGASCFTV